MFLIKLKNFVNKLPSPIAEAIDDVIAPLIKIIVEQASYMLLIEFKEKSEEDAHLTAVELYPVLDVKLEKLAAKTETPIDDAIVEGLMDGIETFASEEGLDLPNLDDD